MAAHVQSSWTGSGSGRALCGVCTTARSEARCDANGAFATLVRQSGVTCDGLREHARLDTLSFGRRLRNSQT
eukprot:4056885-Pleurochrysis_carterae.AAC.5